MKQIQLTNDERIQALRIFGYSEAQARFICLVALHGGYFINRQAAEFLAQEGGGSVTELIEKLFASDRA